MNKQDFQCAAALTLLRSLSNEDSISNLLDAIERMSDYIFGDEPEQEQEQQPEQPAYQNESVERVLEEMERIIVGPLEERQAKYGWDGHSGLKLRSKVRKPASVTMARNVFKEHEITTVGQLVKVGRYGLMEYKKVGNKMCRYLATSLNNLYGITNW